MWNIYEEEKQKLKDLTPQEYEQKIKELAARIDV